MCTIEAKRARQCTRERQRSEEVPRHVLFLVRWLYDSYRKRPSERVAAINSDDLAISRARRCEAIRRPPSASTGSTVEAASSEH
jgi:hypothetical protein